MVENFKFIIFTIIIIALVGLAGFWAFTSIESGSDHVSNQRQKALELKNKELEKELAELKKKTEAIEEQKKMEDKVVQDQKDAVVGTPKPVVKEAEPSPEKNIVSKYQDTITALEKMVSGNIYLKKGSQGAYVGTVQKFLNIYNKTSNKIDNDYGVSTVTLVKNYQKAVGLTADGETGPNTYKKMIAWLKTQ